VAQREEAQAKLLDVFVDPGITDRRVSILRDDTNHRRQKER
jgi:hypothetical protein